MSYCLNCFYFKTRVITNKKRIPHFNFIGKILNLLRREHRVRIFYCIYSLTKSEVYIAPDKLVKHRSGYVRLHKAVKLSFLVSRRFLAEQGLKCKLYTPA